MGIRSPLLKSYGDDFAWSLLDAAPDATLVVGGSGEIAFVSDHAGELFGYGLEELLGRVVDDLLPEGLRAVHLGAPHPLRGRTDGAGHGRRSGAVGAAVRRFAVPG